MPAGTRFVAAQHGRRSGELEASSGQHMSMMPTPDSDLRRQAVTRIKRRRAFWMLLLTYIVVNAFLILVWAFTGRGYFWPGWVLVGWGVGIAFSAISTFASGLSAGNPSEDEIQREIDKQRDRDAA
jgi:hypothetical protein